MANRIGAVAVVLLAGMAAAQAQSLSSELAMNQSYEKEIFFSGEVKLDDASSPPEPVAINRVCNGQSHFETWTDAKGRFSFQVTAGGNDAGQADAAQNTAPPSALTTPIGTSTGTYMPLVAALRDCEVQAVLAGYRSELVSIAVKSRSDNGRLGVITLHSLSRATARTVSATTLEAPANARKAYDRGIDALAKQKWEAAADELTKAVKAYPKFAIAWYQLGLLRQKRNDAAGANEAWKQALASDPKYIRPYESLTALADHTRDWVSSEAYSQAWIQLDPEDFPAAYLYNAVANARLNRTDVAERAAREGLHIDKDHRIPRLNAVLGLILMGKNQSAEAAGYFREYLALAPNANDAAAVRQQLSQLDAAAAARPQ
jgi:tetratricopeptide (TPR) repeat protein